MHAFKAEKAKYLFDLRIFEISKGEAILGGTIDNKLNFLNFIKELCKKTSQKHLTLSRISPYLDSSKKSLILKPLLKFRVD